MNLKAISLFTGAGGLDFGFEAAGFQTAVAVEIDAACCATLRHNRAWTVLNSDLNEVSTTDMLRVGKLRIGSADVLIGGAPCQPFSKSSYWASGDSRRLLDPRASTIGAYMRVLREARPRSFLIENVEGLGFRGKDEGLRLILAELDDINREYGTRYSASFQVLNAADYGVPQHRRRLFIIGARNGKPFNFPSPTHFDPEQIVAGLAARPYATVWDALHNLPTSLNEDLTVKGKWGDLLPSIPEGNNYLWHTERGGGIPLFGWRRRYWSFLLKLAKDRPAWTIQAQPGPATGPFHWSNRRLSMRELARLQTFPRDVLIPGGISEVQKQLGNAVPSLLAEVLAREIKTQLLGIPDERRQLYLHVVPSATPTPPADPPAIVSRKYMKFKGNHAAHPGTGLGPSAMRRNLSAADITEKAA